MVSIVLVTFLLLKRSILIGLCDHAQKRDKELGQGRFSYGFKANGKVANNLKSSDDDDLDDFGPTYAQKDVIGCGYMVDKKEMFFTKNGAFIGIAFKNVEVPKDGFYPAVTIQSMSHSVEANFGTKKFVFDMDGYGQRESLENFFDICSTPFDRAKLHSLVKSYLVHYAYVETLQAYEDDMTGKS